MTYDFRTMTRADLRLVARWLKSPDVVRWWGDPAEQAALIAEDLDNAEMAQWIVSHAGRPFAYAQTYDVHAWPQPHLAALPRGAQAIDAFIGEPALLGVGHGAGFLRALAERLIMDGAPLIAIDPAVDNARARRAYRRAGFRGDTVVQTAEGPAVLMIFTRRPSRRAALNDFGRRRSPCPHSAFALTARALSSGTTVTANGVPASSDRKGSPLRRSLPPSRAFVW